MRKEYQHQITTRIQRRDMEKLKEIQRLKAEVDDFETPIQRLIHFAVLAYHPIALQRIEEERKECP